MVVVEGSGEGEGGAVQKDLTVMLTTINNSFENQQAMLVALQPMSCCYLNEAIWSRNCFSGLIMIYFAIGLGNACIPNFTLE